MYDRVGMNAKCQNVFICHESMFGAGATGVFHCLLRDAGKKNYPGLYIIEFLKGLEMGKEIEGETKRKKKIRWKI